MIKIVGNVPNREQFIRAMTVNNFFLKKAIKDTYIFTYISDKDIAIREMVNTISGILINAESQTKIYLMGGKNNDF